MKTASNFSGFRCCFYTSAASSCVYSYIKRKICLTAPAESLYVAQFFLIAVREGSRWLIGLEEAWSLTRCHDRKQLAWSLSACRRNYRTFWPFWMRAGSLLCARAGGNDGWVLMWLLSSDRFSRITGEISKVRSLRAAGLVEVSLKMFRLFSKRHLQF